MQQQGEPARGRMLAAHMPGMRCCAMHRRELRGAMDAWWMRESASSISMTAK
jgi:hypothetical protein